MYNPLEYLFYQIYHWNKKYFPKSEQPVLNSILAISLLMYCNLITFYLSIELVFEVEINLFEGITAIKIALIVVAILLLNYFLLAFNRRHLRIIEKYNNNVFRNRKLGVIAYVLLSLLALFVSLSYTAVKSANQ